MEQQEMKWGIYIDLGNDKEFELLTSVKFPTRKAAVEWLQDNNSKGYRYHYPQKCVMRISEILERNPNYYD